MKKILLILISFLFAFQVEGQMVIRAQSNARAIASSGSSYTTIYQAVLDAMTEPPTGDTLTWQNAMVYSLDSAGLWTGYMDVFYVFAQRNVQGAYLNWVDPTGDDNITDGASTEFTKYTSFNGDDANDYLNTNFSPKSEAINITDNSVTIAAYLQENTAASDMIIGVTDSDPGSSIRMYPKVAGSNDMQTMINNSSAFSTANTTTAGLALATRRASDDIENYMNGASLGAGTTATGNGLPDMPVYILARNNNNGGADLFSANNVSLVFISKGVTDAQVLIYYNIIQRYMVKLGIHK